MDANLFDGNVLGAAASPVRPEDFKHTCVVVVTGDRINLCGHALLHVGNSWYFHTSGAWHYPRFLTETGYQNYLHKAGKRELKRWPVQLPAPEGAYKKLLELLRTQWKWSPHEKNCVAFIETIVRAGNSDAGMLVHCPVIGRFS